MKRQLPWIAIVAVIIVLFNVCFFTLTNGATDISTSVWVSYVFIHVSLVILLTTPALTLKHAKAGFTPAMSVYAGTAIYFVAALVVNTTFILVSLNSSLVEMYIQQQTDPHEGLQAWLVQMLSNSESIRAAWLLKVIGTPVKTSTTIITNAIMLATCAVYLIVTVSANADTAQQEERHEKELEYVKTCASRLKLIIDTSADMALRKKISQLYDIVASSPARSCPEAKPVEKSLTAMIVDLEEACINGDLQEAERIQNEMVTLARRRNSIVINNNKNQ